CSAPSSTPPSTTTTCPAPPCCARTGPAAPPPPATSPPPPRGLAAARTAGPARRRHRPPRPGAGSDCRPDGMRWGELIALRWDDPRFDQPLDDGAVAGPGRLRLAPAISE